MNYERLRYNAVFVGAGDTVEITRTSVGGFLADTTGTITLIKNNGDGTTTTLLDGMAVVDGRWVDMPFYLPYGGTVTSVGAVGVLAV